MTVEEAADYMRSTDGKKAKEEAERQAEEDAKKQIEKEEQDRIANE